jgi:hypothetical protein
LTAASELSRLHAQVERLTAELAVARVSLRAASQKGELEGSDVAVRAYTALVLRTAASDFSVTHPRPGTYDAWDVSMWLNTEAHLAEHPEARAS